VRSRAAGEPQGVRWLCSQQRRAFSLQVLRELQHKNIVKLQEAYETPSSLILVCELATGGAPPHLEPPPAPPAQRAPPAPPAPPTPHRATFRLTGLPRRALQPSPGSRLSTGELMHRIAEEHAVYTEDEVKKHLLVMLDTMKYMHNQGAPLQGFP